MKGMKYMIGIDPGKSGCVVKVSKDKITSLHFKDCTTQDIVNFIKGEYYAIIEDVHAMPGQGVSSMFNFGYEVGRLHAILDTLGLRWTKVSPQGWKRATGLLKKEKIEAIQYAKRLFPQWNIPKSKAKGISEAEALLMTTLIIQVT
jgi:crossover junction endodeoxyribonuclease RuvC